MVALWISGPTRSGKTHQLIDFAQTTGAEQRQPLIVFAANGDNRMVLASRLGEALRDRVATLTTTPAGFIQDEVILFWPLLVQQLTLQAQFPLKLRPENEQVLATQLWQPRLDDGTLQVEGWRESRTVRRTLDFLQLAAQAGVPIEEIPARLQTGISGLIAPPALWQTVGAALAEWRDWCLQRGLLTYGLMSTLYWRHLLPTPQYQTQLLSRFSGLLADDVDEYPAIARPLFSVFLDAERPCAFTYSPQGKVRLGLGADPEALLPLADRCQVIELESPRTDSLARFGDRFAHWVEDPLAMPDLPEQVSLIQETSRGHMLRTTAEAIAQAVESGLAQPSEIAVIGPGLDAIGRYSLIEILSSRGIALESLSDQRPLVSSPMVRALLSLLALIYPGLGRLVDRDAIAEMLVVLSQNLSLSPTPSASASPHSPPWFDLVAIDPVRAELIADHCFVPDVENPHLLPADTFARWDKLGHRAFAAYSRLLAWIHTQNQLRQQRLTFNPVISIDRIIQDFLWRGNHLPYDQLATLRELTETAQHFWEVEERLRLVDGIPDRTPDKTTLSAVGRFIQLLQKGTVSANPYPVKPLAPDRQGVTLSTIYQYRIQRLTHRWQFWLDAGSPLWGMSAGELFGAPIFLQSWPGRPITPAEIEAANEAQLSRTLRDLAGRTQARIFLCHSDLALTGQEQMGPLLSLVSAAQPVEAATAEAL
ncbi:recombinase family protein [soil metagenome]